MSWGTQRRVPRSRTGWGRTSEPSWTWCRTDGIHSGEGLGSSGETVPDKVWETHEQTLGDTPTLLGYTLWRDRQTQSRRHTHTQHVRNGTDVLPS